MASSSKSTRAAKKSKRAAPARTPAKRAPPAASKTRSTAAKKAATRYAARADLGAPIDGFFVRQPPNLRPVLEAIRALIEQAAPDATAQIKWGMPFFTFGREPICALAGFKQHVSLILHGPPESFADPDGRLEGDAKGGRHLKLRSLDDLPREAVRRWLATAARMAREKAAH